MNKQELKLTLAVGIAVLMLSSCGSQDATTPTTDPAPTTQAAQPAQPEAPAQHAVDAAIPAESLDVRFELLSPPTYVAAQDAMRLKLRVHNNGKTTISGQGKAPFNAGVMLVGPEGADKAPGHREFVRIPLPVIASGARVEIASELPAKDLQRGLLVRVELVQEGINWLPQFGLDIGNFERCAGQDQSLCDTKGSPLVAE